MMGHPHSLPDWVIDLVAGLAKYDTEHPKLYAQYVGSSEWQQADCPCGLLELVPHEVRIYTAGWAAAKSRQALDAPQPDEGTP
jgi:hypothetical protein